MSNNYVYASYKGSQQGVTVRDLGLDQISFINTGFDINGVAAGADNDFYVASANNIYHYRTDGALISRMTFPDTGIIYTSLTVRGDLLFATYKGSQVGVTVRDLNLTQISWFATPFVSSGIAAGPSQDVYLAAGNHIYRYKTNGTQLQDMTFPVTSINYTDVSVLEDRLYASYNGSQLGFTVRDLNLNQLSYCNTGFNISSIAAGASNNVYLTSSNHIYNYSTAGNLLADMNFPDKGVDYTSASVVFTSLT
ncbi:hypothetical protein [Shewanella salipaludis]|uniref:Uncharacterized protein n=1 Tax=Shewanella salipaludis TaxID=2723052 RepID=A0A972JMZ0_9GAMM|nr:hypothetical protein [Shewanella salipaludis]NMH65631.1 hypothetical protein [Shewanella salipaludis]